MAAEGAVEVVAGLRVDAAYSADDLRPEQDAVEIDHVEEQVDASLAATNLGRRKLLRGPAHGWRRSAFEP